MTIGSSVTSAVCALCVSGALLVLSACGAEEAAANDVELESVPQAIVCLALLDLQSDAVRQARERGSLQSLASAKDRWRTQALAAAPVEEVGHLTQEAMTLLKSKSPAEIGDEAANCIARAPR